MVDKFGIIITVENYRSGDFGLNKVKYANSDGDAIKKLFIEKIGIAEDHIRVYQDSAFTCSGFQAEIRYHFGQLSSDTILYFYYAGHGFFMDGRNYLTTYETSTLDMKNTSVSFENVIMEEFRNSKANTFVGFIDACAEGISDKSRSISTRSINYEVVKDVANRSGFNYAIYFACSPEEKSYSSDKLQHGIWTWHIINAFDTNSNLHGIIPCCSAEALKKYLHDAVQGYLIAHPEENIKGQTPYAIISAGNNAHIFEEVNVKHKFEYWIEFYYEEFMSKCYLANIDYSIGFDSKAMMNNFTMATDVCWHLSYSFDFPPDWDDTLNNLYYYASRIQKGRPIDIPHSEQTEILEDIKCVIDSIPTFFDND